MRTWHIGALILLAYLPGISLGILELEMPLPVGKEQVTATLVLAFPDTLAGTDVHALLVAESGTQSVMLPRGKLSASEADFVEGLRVFARGESSEKADSDWARLRGRRFDPILRSCINVDMGFLRCLRGETDAAASLWRQEWRAHGPAQEGAWRNLLGLYLAQRQFDEANQLLDQVLRQQPHNRVAALAKASLLRQLRPDSEWEDFLRSESSPRDSLPDLQIAYGELLENQGQYEDAVHFLDLGLDKMSEYGRGWFLLADAQYHLGYDYFALDCLANAGRAGYNKPDLYELYARTLRDCCMGDDDPRAAKAIDEAQHFLEEGLPKDLQNRSMAQLLYHIYCENLNPEAAERLKEDLWFHFEGPSHDAPVLGYEAWPQEGLDAQGLHIEFGLYDLTWVMALSHTDFYQAVY